MDTVVDSLSESHQNSFPASASICLGQNKRCWLTSKLVKIWFILFAISRNFSIGSGIFSSSSTSPAARGIFWVRKLSHQMSENWYYYHKTYICSSITGTFKNKRSYYKTYKFKTYVFFNYHSLISKALQQQSKLKCKAVRHLDRKS